MSYAKNRDKLVRDKATSFALVEVIRAFERRDPIDALRDAETLAALCRERLNEALLIGSPAACALAVADCARELLMCIDNLTTQEFAAGGERVQREALRTALDHLNVVLKSAEAISKAAGQ